MARKMRGFTDPHFVTGTGDEVKTSLFFSCYSGHSSSLPVHFYVVCNSPGCLHLHCSVHVGFLNTTLRGDREKASVNNISVNLIQQFEKENTCSYKLTQLLTVEINWLKSSTFIVSR